ncbi:methyltransferase [Paenibacillus terrae]
MIKLDKNKIRRFRSFLDDFCYDITYQFLSGESNYFFNPWQTFETLKYGLSMLENKTRSDVFKLLLLGENISEKESDICLGMPIKEDLLDIGILKRKENGTIQTDGYSLLSICDRYLFVGLPYYYPTCINKDPDVYIGPDTYKLSRIIPSKNVESMVDLCSGSGIQAILGANFSKKSIGVEINPLVVPVTRLNVMLNDLEEKIEIKEGNLYEPLKGMTFDLITSNPPFIPVPDHLEFSLAGDGGNDGLNIVKEIIKGYKLHLNVDGYGVMIGEAIGNEQGPFLTRLLDEELGKCFDTKLFLSGRIHIDSQIKTVSSLNTLLKKNPNVNSSEIENIWRANYRKLNATYYYTFSLKTKKLDSESGGMEVINVFNKWTLSHIPKITYPLKYELQKEKWNVFIGEELAVLIDEEAKEFLQLCDGEKTIEEIKKIVEKNTNENLNPDQILATCNILESKGILQVL